MNIVLLPSPPFGEIGGVSTHVYMLAKGLRALGHRVHVVPALPPRWFRAPLITLPALLLGLFSGYVSQRYLQGMNNLYYIASALWRTRLEIDVLNVQNVRHYSVAALLHHLTGCRTILTVHGYLTYEAEAGRQCRVGGRLHRWLWSLEKNGYERHDAIVCVAEKTRRYIEQFTTKEIYLINNGVDTKEFSPAPNQPKSAGKPITILFAGILQAAKGIMEALDVIRRIVERKHAVIFRVAGNGPQEGEARQYVATHRLENHVEFLGALKKENMPDFYRSGDLLLFTSKQAGLSGRAEESLPYSVVEAMASALPVVAFHTGGLGELVIHGETGFLCEAGDVQQCAAYIERLMEEAALLDVMRKQSRKYCLEKFSHLKMAKQFLSVYEKAEI